MRVVGVIHLEKYRGCLKCKTKLVPDEDDPDLGLCQKCNIMQCFDTSHQGLSAQLMVEGGWEKLTLRAFGKVLEDIVEKPFTWMGSSSLSVELVRLEGAASVNTSVMELGFDLSLHHCALT